MCRKQISQENLEALAMEYVRRHVKDDSEPAEYIDLYFHALQELLEIVLAAPSPHESHSEDRP